MLIKEQFFPTTVYGKDLQLDNNTLAQHIIQWSQQDQGVKKTNMNGWHSTTDMHLKKEYQVLVDELYKMQHEPPVRKISMTLLLNDPSEFEGGDLELMAPGKFAKLKQGHAIIFASFINHRVNPVKRGIRQSLVVWFGGKPFR